MSEPLVIVGAGGFGREVLDVAEATNAASSRAVWDIVGVVDDAPSSQNLDRLDRRGVGYLGAVDSLPQGARVAVAVGCPRTRRALDEKLTGRGVEFATLIHPAAVIGSQVLIGDAAVVCALVSIGTNVRLGRHVHLNPHAVIGHDTALGDFVSVNPNATVSGDCHVGDNVLIGAAALVLQGIRVGSSSTIGGCACVVKDLPPEVTVKGVPAQ
jgi:sugar O-acyltransferase (sialic acid O-acetyltransferase NeuD family)